MAGYILDIILLLCVPGDPDEDGDGDGTTRDGCNSVHPIRKIPLAWPFGSYPLRQMK